MTRRPTVAGLARHHRELHAGRMPMDAANERALVRDIARAALPLAGGRRDYDALLDAIGARRFVLLGEASHGTHEFYAERAEITKRLIEEKGFTAVAVEADWPDAYRVNRYVRGQGEDEESVDALAGFRRFPTWMWRNADVLDFVGWLRAYNEADASRSVGFYGLDLYSLYASIEAVLAYLDRHDRDAAERARRRYACFDQFDTDTQAYGYLTGVLGAESCEDAVVAELFELQRRAATRSPAEADRDELFFAEQNARLVKNAEAYYRAMFRGSTASWNLRDRHMLGTLEALTDHLGPSAKVAVWAHNAHLCDARATEMHERGELSVGQLVRAIHGRSAFLVGMTTYEGTVTAASDWEEPAERKRVRPALEASYEALLHRVGLARFLLPLSGASAELAGLHARRLERAIGVVYRPETERSSHYFFADLAAQFDALLHFDVTRAVEPLECGVAWTTGEPPETYPVAV